MKFLLAGLLLVSPVPQDEPPPEAAKAAESAKQIVYKKTDQGDLTLYVHFPPDWKQTDKRPGIVFFHGGGFTGGTPNQFSVQCEYLATRGMVAATAQYRLLKSKPGVTLLHCVEDAKSAVRWFRQNAATLGVDPDRIAAGGGSAGGHLATTAAVVEGLVGEGEDAAIPARPDLLVLFNPVMAYEPLASRDPDNKEAVKKVTPNLNIRKGQPDALMCFGTEDKLLEGAKEFMAKSKDLGNQVELYLAEGQGHGFFNKSPWKERALYRADEFLAAHGYVQGKPALQLPPEAPKR